MSRSLIRFAVALAPPLLAILVAAALANSAGLRQSISRASPDAVGRYCYALDLANYTGQDANGLRIRLKGNQNISDVYTGAANPFGSPDTTSGYDVGTDIYTLVFSNGVALNGDTVHVGLCTDQPSLQAAQQLSPPPVYWTLDGQALQPSPLSAGARWDWQSSTHLQLRLFNSQPVSVTLMSLDLLDAGASLALDDLDADVAGQLPLVSSLAPDPETLPPGATSLFDVFFDTPTYDHPYVLQAVLTAEDDSGNTFSLFSQSSSPPALVFLPIVMR